MLSRSSDLGRILAIDYGTHRIGLALSDPLQLTAQPFDTWDTEAPDLGKRLAALMREKDVELIVVGLPLSLSGSEGPSAGLARQFADKVRDMTGLEVELVDERFSTTTAERALLEANVRRADRRERRDRVAAAVILQQYLSQQK